jgi:hypothetical protein
MNWRVAIAIGAQLLLVLRSSAAGTEQADRLFKKAIAGRGTAYSESMAQVVADPSVTQVVQRAIGTREGHVLGLIVEQRVVQPEVFAEFRQWIAVVREDMKAGIPRMDRPVPIGNRGQYLKGLLVGFAAQGPESTYVDEYVGRGKQDGLMGEGPLYRRVEKYTAKDVALGKARNRAARMAILEHFLKFAEEGDPYEQKEVATAVYGFWGKNANRPKDDGIDIDGLLRQLAEDASYHVSMRIAAVSELPWNQRGGERQLHLEAIGSATTDDESRYGWLVLRSVGHVKSEDAAALRSVRTLVGWKQRLIEEATREASPAVPSPGIEKKDGKPAP